LLLVTPSSAQDLEHQYYYSISLFNNEDYFNAVTEFKRLLFFDSAGEYKYSANFYIGRSYKAGARLNEAIQFFAESSRSAKSQEEVFASEIEIVKTNILRQTFVQAHSLLNKMESAYPGKADHLNYWRGWVYMFNDEWDKAADEFRKIDHDHELARLATQVDEDQYSVTLAKTLSYIIPGSGQFYTGEYLSGIMSLGWNVLWGYLTINAFVEDRIFDGVVIANFLWLRFYRGNVQNAEKFAIERNIEISNKALNYLQFRYPGEKP
jgi:tetratricopeptide (TPR) repeat protein